MMDIPRTRPPSVMINLGPCFLSNNGPNKGPTDIPHKAFIVNAQDKVVRLQPRLSSIGTKKSPNGYPPIPELALDMNATATIYQP